MRSYATFVDIKYTFVGIKYTFVGVKYTFVGVKYTFVGVKYTHIYSYTIMQPKNHIIISVINIIIC